MVIVMHGTLVNELFQLSFIHSLNNEEIVSMYKKQY